MRVERTPYEALYGRKCRTPLAWVEAGEARVVKPNEMDEANSTIRTIRERLLNCFYCNVPFAVRGSTPLGLRRTVTGL
ncbi:hypothetical protein KSP40_PGU000654 [Platanthera guangdongensis]|uniref:Uncharacterized protein n=1 Tax=Platanthera guangdongensis TaxID=2320717 RepID=A0ABR2MKX0_9ASPA